VTWLDFVADTRIAVYDTKAGTWSEPVLIGKGTDNHGGPALTMDRRGYLYVALGPHHGPFQIRRSTRPHRVDEWEPATRTGVKATYPSLVCDPNDNLHLAYRGGPSPGWGGWWLMYQRRPKDGTWSSPLVILKPQGRPQYTQYGNSLAVSSDGTIHLGFHIYAGHPTKAKGTRLGYLRSRDNGDTWEGADGKALKLPVSPRSLDFIEQGRELDMRIGNLVLGPAGRPWLTAAHYEKRPRSTTLWHLEEDGWKAIDLLPFLQKRFPGHEVVTGTMTFDRDGVLYVAAVVQPAGLKVYFGAEAAEVVLFASKDRGKSFDILPMSRPDPDLPNWLPSIERPYGAGPLSGTPSLLFTHGDKGEFGKNQEGRPTEIRFVRLGR
jgi:hypothetical protein